MAKEIFEYNSVAAAMTNIGSIKDSAKKELDGITEELSAAITNTQGEDQALGGSIGPIWDKWNIFAEKFVAFSNNVNATIDKVSGTTNSASSTNQSYENVAATNIGGTTSQN